MIAALATAGFASAEPSGEAVSVEDAFAEYIHDWLLAEMEVNANLTIEQVEDAGSELEDVFDDDDDDIDDDDFSDEEE